MLINKKNGKNYGEFQNINGHPELAAYIASTFAIVISSSEKKSNFWTKKAYFKPSARALKNTIQQGVRHIYTTNHSHVMKDSVKAVLLFDLFSLSFCHKCFQTL